MVSISKIKFPCRNIPRTGVSIVNNLRNNFSALCFLSKTIWTAKLSISYSGRVPPPYRPLLGIIFVFSPLLFRMFCSLIAVCFFRLYCVLGF